jgi:hypothetical protein
MRGLSAGELFVLDESARPVLARLGMRLGVATALRRSIATAITSALRIAAPAFFATAVVGRGVAGGGIRARRSLWPGGAWRARLRGRSPGFAPRWRL